jgi:bifunctional non-homologous end joining protein LigD
MLNWVRPSRTRRPTGFIPPMIPTEVTKPPSGGGWLHEIKHDGYRMQLAKITDRVRLFTRRGGDWTDRYPRVTEAAKKIKASSFSIDGELVVADGDGVANFAMLHSRDHDASAMLWAFDLLALDGEDLHQLPLVERKTRLAKLLKRSRQFGIGYSDHLEGDGDVAFEQARTIGLEGIVSKRRDSVYRSGRTKAWVKIKNPNAPGVTRFQNRE